ncbi:hypothetical protein BRAS3843_2020041 [Bradyrhizobium sp. STM 3843]|nr:hypothetical protein BRAS3843_2020041 [Bradyrhizobium sp. STM 3843]
MLILGFTIRSGLVNDARTFWQTA